MTPEVQESPVDKRIDSPAFYQDDYEAIFARLASRIPCTGRPRPSCGS